MKHLFNFAANMRWKERNYLLHNEFLRIKRSLPEGTEWKVTSLLSSFEELMEKMGDRKS